MPPLRFIQGREVDCAEADLHHILGVDPSNADATKELRRVQTKLKEIAQRERAAYSTLFS